jgi:hypothetical protein
MDVHVDTNEKPGQSPGKRTESPGKGLFRRRVVFELDAAQLPLLETAEARHGSKRAALIAALGVERSAAELLGRAERAEAQLVEQQQGAEEAKKGEDDGQAKLERELAAARKKLAKAGKAEAELHEELEESRETLNERDAEAADLRVCAVDRIYCARCGQWVAPEEWSWAELEDGGSYAFHRTCGDHAEGIRGSSWLALRR